MIVPFGKPIIGEEERAAVAEVLAGDILVHGPRAIQFEADFAAYTGSPHAVSVSSCTAGMHLVWFTLGLTAGDEVIVPAMTHTATAHAVELTGATAVFVDVEPATGNIDIDQIEAAITPRTKAIAVVHYLGMPVDMPRVMEIARKHNLFVMEDCALAPGTRIDGVHAGLLGDVGVFSFYPVKHITTAEGGIVITRDGELAAKLRLLKAFGVDRNHGERKVPGMYDVVALGFNYRMSELHAAIGIAQLKRLDGFLAARERNDQALRAALAAVPQVSLFETTNDRLVSSYYCLSVMLAPEVAIHREKIMAAMSAQGIGTSIYYPQPVPRMTYYRQKYGWEESRYPNATAIADRSIALPVGPHINETHMALIADGLRNSIEEVCK